MLIKGTIPPRRDKGSQDTCYEEIALLGIKLIIGSENGSPTSAKVAHSLFGQGPISPVKLKKSNLKYQYYTNII